MFLCKPPAVTPSLFFCHPEASAEGSLGTGVPRDDIPGRRPEQSEGCLAIARHDEVWDFFEQPHPWLKSSL